MTCLLDSTFLIDLLRRRESALSVLKLLLGLGHTLATSTIAMAEIYAGARDVELVRITALFEDMLCFDVSPSIARRAGAMKRSFSREGRTVGLDDMLIAATALEYDCMLVTDNLRDFEVPGLRIFSRPL